MITVGSLFSGIGGIDLGLERAGMRVIWQAEIDPYACRVLARHWPDVPNLGDVTQIEWSDVTAPDLICGGYPCQPFSYAGSRKGERDPRHLWPYAADAIRVLRPRWALLENVPGHLALGFGSVLADMAACGYCIEWDCIPAAAIGAPHLRDRLFIVASLDGASDAVSDAIGGGLRHERQWLGQQHEQPRTSVAGHDGASGSLAYADSEAGRPSGDPVCGSSREPLGAASAQSGRCSEALAQPDRQGQRDVASDAQVAGIRGAAGSRHGADADSERRRERTGIVGSPRGWGEFTDGSWWAAEPDVGRMADGVPSRVDRLRVLGNAVVPQVAEAIGRRIMEVAS